MHYDLCIQKGVFQNDWPGLRVLDHESFISFTNSAPSPLYETIGDVFSDYSIPEISDKLDNIFEGTYCRAVNVYPWDPKLALNGSTVLIQEPDGIRLFLPCEEPEWISKDQIAMYYAAAILTLQTLDHDRFRGSISEKETQSFLAQYSFGFDG